jgi:hypothetical protein
MCASVIIDGHLLESQGALKNVLGDLIYLSDAPVGATADDNGCLCWVDIPAMAERNGLGSTWDGMDWVLTRASQHTDTQGE